MDARVAKEKRRGVKEIYGQTLYSSYSSTVFFFFLRKSVL